MNLLEYTGNFHLLVIHLPIGILTVFLILGFCISRKRLLNAISIVKVILAVSALSALFSSISGYILSNSGSYDTRLVSFHQWLGFLLTIFNAIVYFKIEFILKASVQVYRITLGVLLITMVLTGHAGGSLTHGSDFLNPPALNQWFSSGTVEESRITLNSTAYEAVSVVFEQKCLVCHGKNKQRGELRLDTKKAILTGGESGPVITGTSGESLLIQSLLLPLDHKDHMPPKEKTQLTETEIKFLAWWIDAGADFEKSLTELQFPDSLNDILYKEEITIEDPVIPKEEVKAADEKILEELRALDVIVVPIGKNSNSLSVNFVNVLKENVQEVMDKLIGVSPQIVWLDMSYLQLEDDLWKKLGQLTNLRKLSLRYSSINDLQLAEINSLDKLVILNLVGTKITVAGIQNIKNLKNLEALYLYQTNIEKEQWDQIKITFPKAKIDFGDYIVPILESDTTVFTL